MSEQNTAIQACMETAMNHTLGSSAVPWTVEVDGEDLVVRNIT